jgi:hypothetical protein
MTALILLTFLFRLSFSSYHQMKTNYFGNAITLVLNLEKLVDCLDRSKSLEVHSKIDQAFYMEKLAQMKALLHQYDFAQRRLDEISGWIDRQTSDVTSHWQRDLEWLIKKNVCKG